jgi:hypothetical protein
VIERAGEEVFRCSLSDAVSDRWLEVPAWMFDRAVSATWRVGAVVHADFAALGALSTLLRDATPVPGTFAIAVWPRTTSA